MPVILVLFDASRKRAYWLATQHYFRDDVGRQSVRGAKTVRVRVPKTRIVDRQAITLIRELKQQKRRPTLGVQP